MGSLTAVPGFWTRWNFEVRDGQRPVAKLDLNWVREKGTIEVDGESFRVGRDGLVSGDFYLDRGTRRLASAHKPSAFRRAFELEVPDEYGVAVSYRLQASSAFRRKFDLLRGTQIVGSIGPVSLFRRTARIDLPEALSLPVQVFAFWLVVLLWKRQEDAD